MSEHTEPQDMVIHLTNETMDISGLTRAEVVELCAARLAALLNEMDARDIDVYPKRNGADWSYDVQGTDHVVADTITRPVRMNTDDVWVTDMS